MIALVADNNAETLAVLTETVREALPHMDVLPFQDELQAAQYVSNNPVDLFFARADNRRMSGFDMLRFVRKARVVPSMVLVSDNASLRDDVMRAGAFGFLLRPATACQVRELLEGRDEE